MEPAVLSANIFRFGLFEADAVSATLTRKGVRVKIQDQPFRVLTLLLDHPGEIVTREELRQKLWPEGTYVDFDGSLNVILKKLRAAIDDDSDNPRFIETVPRRGYRFIAPVSAIRPKPIPVQEHVIPPAPESAASEVTLLPPLPQSAPRPLPLPSAMVAAVLIGAALTGWLVWRGKQSATLTPFAVAQPAPPVQMRRSVAVLGFHNISGKTGDLWLATAFSEMLSTELAGGEKLRLVSGEDVANLHLTSPWSQTDTLDQKTTSRIGTALSSDVLVLGSYAVMGAPDRGRLRLDVRMQEAKTGEILTEIAEIGNARDLFHIVSRVGDKLRDRLEIPSLEGTDEAGVLASLPLDREAARFYARGLAKLREFDSLGAKDLLEQASKADPKFSLVHLMLARALSQLGYEQKRKDEAKKALDLSADLPPAARLLVEGDYYESLADHEKAASTYRALFEMFPDRVEYGLRLAGAQIAGGSTSQASSTLSQLRALPAPASDDPRIDLTDVRATPKNDPARLVLIRSAMQKASAQGKKMIYAQARKEECLNLIYGEHPDQGLPACEDAFNIFMAAGNRLGAADAIRLRGDYEGSRGHLEQAIATYQKALNILQELGEHLKIGAVLNNMAIDIANEGKPDRAEQFYRQAKLHFEQAGDKALTAVAIGNIADILYLRGDLPGAAKMYEQALEIQNSLDQPSPGYLLYRLSDLDLALGRVREAHQLAQSAIDAIRPNQGGYQYLTSAINMLGDILKSEGDLTGARKQFEESLAIQQKVGEPVGETQVELADLALDEGRLDHAETPLRSAIAEFEKEKADPDTISAYTVLSRALLKQGKVNEAHNAIGHAAELARGSSDPTLKLSIAIQNARVEMANAAQETELVAARMQLHATIATAKRLGYYGLECEARLALAELESKINPAWGRNQLNALGSETRSRGFELLARQAEQAVTATGTATAANRPAR
jgi:eukaryotic-like serine/threonine-protein kinase